MDKKVFFSVFVGKKTFIFPLKCKEGFCGKVGKNLFLYLNEKSLIKVVFPLAKFRVITLANSDIAM